MTPTRKRRLLRLSCWLTLVSLSLCLWSLLVPTPISVITAMSAAQGLGTLAFGLYLVVLYFDLRLSRSIPEALGRTPEKDRR